MLPYFFSAAHWNYPRYIQSHIIDMQTLLPGTMLTAFLHGEHVVGTKVEHGIQFSWISSVNKRIIVMAEEV